MENIINARSNDELLKKISRIGNMYEEAYGTFEDRSRLARDFFQHESAVISYDGCVRINKTDWADWSQLRAFVEYFESIHKV